MVVRDASMFPAMIDIRPAAGGADIETIRHLFLEYAAGLDVDLCFQGFDDELAQLPGYYSPPAGGLWIASVDGMIAGCVALRPLEPGVCEIKRLYLKPGFRGAGLGRLMAETVIEAARAQGYGAMRLDTLDSMQAAQQLYRTMGFVERPPYGDKPHERLSYFELAL